MLLKKIILLIMYTHTKQSEKKKHGVMKKWNSVAEQSGLVTGIFLYDKVLLIRKDLACSRLGLTGWQMLLSPTLNIIFLLLLLFSVGFQLARLFVCQSLQFWSVYTQHEVKS